MKLKVFIDKNREEEIVIYTHEKTKLVEAIETLVAQETVDLVGYKDKEAVKLNLSIVNFFSISENKVYAFTDSEKLLIKNRLYQLEKMLPESFVKINQSCIANTQKMIRFDASFSGTLTVSFENGMSDWVSRRNVKSIKERLGIK